MRAIASRSVVCHVGFHVSLTGLLCSRSSHPNKRCVPRAIARSAHKEVLVTAAVKDHHLLAGHPVALRR